VIRPERPASEISVQKVGHTVLAVSSAAAAALIVWKLSIWRVIGPIFGLVFFFVTFIVFAVVLYCFFEWLFRKGQMRSLRGCPRPARNCDVKRSSSLTICQGELVLIC